MMSEELKEKMIHILGLCHGSHECWYSKKYAELKREGISDSDVELQMDFEQVGALLELFEEYAKQIIGEDDKEEDENCAWGHDFHASVRNILRAEQRSKLESQKKEEV